MMEREIDLRPYILALLRRWRMIVVIPLAAALATGLVFALLPQSSQAEADLMIVPTSPQVNLDPRFVDRDATLITNSTFQRQALINLASSGAIEARVAKELGLELDQPGLLLDRVKIDAGSDLIRITASAPTPGEATKLAEAWGRSYEALVAEVYRDIGTGSAQVAQDLAAAQENYDTAQLALEEFLGQDEVVRVQEQSLRIEGLLNGSSEAQQTLYRQYLLRTQELDLILQDARTLRGQVSSAESGNVSDSIVLLALRARAAGSIELPVQLRIDDNAALARDAQATLADLDGLIRALEQQVEALQTLSVTLSQALAAGEGSSVGLGAADRASYEDELTGLRRQSEQLSGQRQVLTQRRDVAFSSLELLQRKSAEQQITQANAQFAVRFLNASLAPRPSSLTQAVIGAFGALVAGVLFSLGLALVLDIVRPRLRAAVGPVVPQQVERPADRPTATRAP